MKLSEPVHFNGCTRFPLSDIERAEAEAKGQTAPAPRSPEDERYLSVKQVAERFNVSVPTIWRWSRKEDAGVAA